MVSAAPSANGPTPLSWKCYRRLAESGLTLPVNTLPREQLKLEKEVCWSYAANEYAASIVMSRASVRAKVLIPGIFCVCCSLWST